ncbi:hypothetical protein GJA_4772 [Janthinobacterium agaricidamnosum NBRC 102515 = DSM 9628]|uniref:Uncharacterized protein n=2 Tax=Janthinobacterium agaricidamnosum TaxID=55508 RepID=W0VBW6_9BURK|nr:hypothetical protein GJA_4772 [Janthinobacterium agaricidamnosum NBRC 102515 = DSM 9628]
MSLAFLARGRLVHYARHDRKNGDFTPLPARQPIPVTSAVFRVVRKGVASDLPAWRTLVLE